jgi:predicted P-loop ATPase
MHITLNEEGKVKIFNTFKGLNPSCNDSDTGRRMHTDYVDNITSQALLEINEKGYMNPIEVSQWKRNLENGITIGTHQQKSEMETYLDHSVGVYFVLDDFNNFYEFFSPHGVKGCYLIEEERTEMIEKSGFMKTYAEVKDFIASLYPKKDKVYEVDSEEYRNVVRILSTN